MKTGRFFLILASAMLVDCLMLGTAFAGFGFGGDSSGKSGLDFTGGYDLNTVTSVSGKVSTPPRTGEQDHTIIEISTPDGKTYLDAGPASFWRKSGINVHENDDVSAKGSLAQGRNGRVYLLTQKLTDLTTGDRLEVRGTRGDPLWLEGTRNGINRGGFTGGMGHGGFGGMGMGRGMTGMGRMGR